jgi:hypothetical protein
MTAAVGLTGGCLCNSIRYRLDSAPFDAGYCHCSVCRRSSGAPVMAFATVPVESWIVTCGVPRCRRSSKFGSRWFCGDCGTQLAMQVDHQPETIDFTIASLDRPEVVQPTFHIFHADRIAWFEVADACPRSAQFREETRGL